MADVIFDLVRKEEQRLKEKIGLIPSENHTSDDVYRVLSSCLSSKYSEGYPGRRYYEGSQIIDEIERLAQDRVKSLFGVPYVNVQPYSGSPANLAVWFALMNPGDTLMGLKLSCGGHLTHGHPDVSGSGAYYKSVQYGLDDNARIDFDALRKLAKKHKPKVIVAGTTAYPFELNFKKFRAIADEVGAWLVADISHITGLVIGEQHMSPVPYVDVVTTTTHKTFRGPRGAMILVTERGLKKDADLGKKIDSAIIPGLQGGPHNATTASIAIAAKEASTAKFKQYAKQIRLNADALADALKREGLTLVGNGTDNHLILVDLTPQGAGLGYQVAYAMDVAGMYANRNTIPNEPVSPFYPSGLRLGTPLVTTRGMKIREMKRIAKWIAQVVDYCKEYQPPSERSERIPFMREFKKKMAKDTFLLGIAEEVKKMAVEFPLFKE